MKYVEVSEQYQPDALASEFLVPLPNHSLEVSEQYQPDALASGFLVPLPNHSLARRAGI